MTDTPVRGFYGRWARLYDLLATLPGVGSWRRQTVAALALDPDDTVVEMGCGTGANVPYLRQRVSHGRIVGVDLTREMLQRAHTGDDRVDLVQADATRPPIRTADAILATFVVGLFEQPARAVDRWCDCVGTGGRVALLNFQRSDRTWAPLPNLAFEVFVRLASPGGRLSRSSQATTLQRRVRAAREALVGRTTECRFETFAGGYLGLVVGRVA